MPRKPSRVDKLVFAGIVGLLIFAPLAFGSVHVWAYTLVELGVFFLLLLWFLDRLFFSNNESLKWVQTSVNILLILLIVYIGFQIVPLPTAWVAFFSPRTAADKFQLVELMAAVGSGAGRGVSLAYFCHPVVIEGLKILTYLGMFFLVLNTARSKRQLNILIYVLIFMGLFQVMYGIYQVFSVNPRIWWWANRSAGAGRATGTYIVANHFAGYLELIIPLVFGFIIAQRRRQRIIITGLGGTRSVVQRFVGLLAPESANARMIFLFFSAIVLALGLLFSGSRGGIISVGAGMLGVFFLFLSKGLYRKYSALSVVFCLLAFSYGVHIGIETTLRRFERVENLEERLYITQTIVPMVKDYSLTGVGLGNFKYLYPRYTPDAFNRVSSSGYAHNDWIEAFAELGFIGGGLILAAVVVYLIKMIRLWRSRNDLYALGIGAGVMAALLSLTFHSYFDFNMHIPANPLTLAALLAIGYAAMHIQGRGFKESFFYRLREIKLTRSRRIFVMLAVLFIFGGSSYIAGSHFMAETNCPTEWNSTLNLNWNPDYPEIRRAIAVNPYNAAYHNKMAGFYFRMAANYNRAGISDPTLQQEFNEWAIASLVKAVRLNPAKEHYWFDLGKRYSFKNYDSFNYINKWLPLAEACFEQAIKCAPKDPYMLFSVAWYWVWRSSLFSPKTVAGSASKQKKPVLRSEGIQKFQDLFQRSLTLDKRRWKRAVERVWEYYPDDTIVLGIIPDGAEELKREVLKMVVMKEK